MGDKVNHPDHYQNIAGVEAIDILNDVVKDLPGKQAAMLWNAMKYLLRFQNKNGVEDLKKARNYLDYLIADMDAVCDAAEKLWDTWHSNEYGHVWIFAGTNPKGMPTKLIFETKDAAEEFKSVFYNMLSEGYDEFSIADACLEMKFKFTKGNKLNNWDELVPWEKVHNRFSIKEVVGTDTKTKVDRAIIIVEGTREKPYFGILYHEVGKDYDNIGFGSYCLNNVFNWREQYLEVVSKEDK